MYQSKDREITDIAAWRLSLLMLVALMTMITPAHAHLGAGNTTGLLSGFTHPITGLDHVVAMVAVGLWGAFLGAPSIWALPIIFPLIMAFGGALGMLGFTLSHVELGIALSALALGLLVLFRVQAPTWAAGTLVGLFAIFHGYAHGVELPASAAPLTYALGFVVATGLLHLFGIAIGLLTKWPSGVLLVRGSGGVIALTGAAYLSGII